MAKEFKVKGQKEYVKCPFPNCPSMAEKSPPGQPPRACHKHSAFVSDMIFALSALGIVKVTKEGRVIPAWKIPPSDASSILVPKPGMGDKAVKEVASKLILPGQDNR